MKRILSVLPFLFFAVLLMGQGKTVSGLITASEDGLPVIGATILIKGTASGTVTDIDGTYSVNVPSDNAILVISYTGLKTQEITVGDRTQIDVQMESSVSILDEVVVTGYGSQGRRVLTSSVSSVDAKEIENLPTPNVDQMLQGRAAGVQVNSNSGTPGGSIFVRVRGTTSITAGSDPLYIVDGIPIVSNPIEAEGTGGQRTSPISDINPADIQSIEVLKDAAATSIYGARAANGVVIITTKRGTKGKNAKVSLNAYYGVQNFWKDPRESFVNSTDFEILANEAAVNRGQTAPYANPGSGANTDWIGFIFQEDAPMYNIDLSVSGGSDRIRYFISGNQFDQQGIMLNNAFKRQSGRINLDFDATDKVTIGTSILYSRTDRTRSDNDNNIFGGLGAAFFSPTNIPAFQPDGSLTKFSIFESPIAVAEFQDLSMFTNRVLASAYGEWDITNKLSFKSQFNVDYNNVQEDAYWPTQMNEGAAVNGQARSTSTIDDNWIWENTMTYQTSLGGEHYLTALAGYSAQQSTFRRTQAFGQQFPSNDFRRIASAAVQTSTSTGSQWGIASIFGRLNYNFADKYLVNVNVRRDGSSRFGEDNRWGTFPSVGVGWRLSQEEFMKGSSFINELKLRGSWGITGNQNGINDFAPLGLWIGDAAYTNTPGTRPEQLANPDLKWEETTQWNVGVDLAVLNERLTLTFDVYEKNTTDLLLNVPLPRTTGFNSQFQNIGEMSNKGWELGIGATVVNNSDFNWNINFNVAHNEAIIEKLVAPINVYTRDLIRLEEGVPMFSFWLHEQLGVDAQTGDVIWRTVNGDSRTETFNSSRDRFFVGDAQPDLFGGLTNNLSFKGFDFSMFWQFSLGNDQLHWNRFFQEHGGGRNTGYHSSQLDRWQQPGDITDVPRQTAANYRSDLRPSRFLEDGSYIRLKNASLGYNFPANITQKIGMSNLRLYVTGQNLITITDYTGLDPELNSGANDQLAQGIELYAFPQARVFTFGISSTF